MLPRLCGDRYRDSSTSVYKRLAIIACRTCRFEIGGRYEQRLQVSRIAVGAGTLNQPEGRRALADHTGTEMEWSCRTGAQNIAAEGQGQRPDRR